MFSETTDPKGSASVVSVEESDEEIASTVIEIDSGTDDGERRTLTQELEALLEEEWGSRSPQGPAADCDFDDEDADNISEGAFSPLRPSEGGGDEIEGFSESEL